VTWCISDRTTRYVFEERESASTLEMFRQCYSASKMHLHDSLDLLLGSALGVDRPSGDKMWRRSAVAGASPCNSDRRRWMIGRYKSGLFTKCIERLVSLSDKTLNSYCLH
jgi:hypothetical protein